MKFGNREKIIAVSVVALGLIAGLHFAVFAPKASQYDEAVRAYSDARSQLDSTGQPPPEDQLVTFQDTTLDYQLRLMNFLKDANLLIPEGFSIPVAEAEPAPAEGEEGYEEVVPEDPAMGMAGMFGPWGMMGGGVGMGGTTAQAIPEKEYEQLTYEQKQSLASKLRELEQLRDAGAPTRLTFMDAENQWNILRQLPDNIRRGNVDVADLIRSLQGTDAIIKQSGEKSRLRYDRQSQYVGELRRVGLDQVKRQGLTPNPQAMTLVNGRNNPSILRDYGNLAAVMYTLNRINLIMQAVPAESLNYSNQKDYYEELEDLLRLDTTNEDDRKSDITYIQWKVQAYDGLKQLEALIDLIKMARETGVFEVSSVKFWEPVDVEWIDPATDTAQQDPNAASGMMGPSMMGGDPALMMGDPALMMGGDPTMMMMNPWMFGGGMMQPAGPTGEVVGTSTPIEIEVRGSNRAVMSFAHMITNSRRLYSINSMYVNAETGQANVEISARFVIHVMSRLKNPTFQMTEAQFQQRMAEIEGTGGAVAGGGLAPPLDSTMEGAGALVP